MEKHFTINMSETVLRNTIVFLKRSELKGNEVSQFNDVLESLSKATLAAQVGSRGQMIAQTKPEAKPETTCCKPEGNCTPEECKSEKCEKNPLEPETRFRVKPNEKPDGWDL